MKYSLVFPGQGSQSLHMMAGFKDYSVVRDTFAEASGVLGQNLWDLAECGPDELLNQTVNTQPLMLTAGVAVFRAWQSLTETAPLFLAGHSLGEYTALVASNAISFSDALGLVRFRAQVMQEAVPEGEGAIAAILGLDDEAVRGVCLESAQSEIVEAVNYNSPGQVVIAGNREAVSRAMALAREKGAKRAIMLPMSVPSHCSLLKEAALRLEERLQPVTVNEPEIPVLHNVDARPHGKPSDIKSMLVRQLYSPVLWVDTIKSLSDEGITHILECGPGKVLTGLNKRIDANLQSLGLVDGASLEQARDILGEKNA